MGRQTTNYKKRALHQIEELKTHLVAKYIVDDASLVLISKLNKLKSTIEKIRSPQTRYSVKKNANKNL